MQNQSSGHNQVSKNSLSSRSNSVESIESYLRSKVMGDRGPKKDDNVMSMHDKRKSSIKGKAKVKRRRLAPVVDQSHASLDPMASALTPIALAGTLGTHSVTDSSYMATPSSQSSVQIKACFPNEVLRHQIALA